MLEKPDFHREFRLGLVVYGGVSLAIYMNGVCREFYNAVRGRGIYKLIKALTDSDIVVDIISGTSAGGVNGVLLSYALTNNVQVRDGKNKNESTEKTEICDFESFASVWRDSGDINLLLRPINSKGDVNSVLDGEEYYQKQLVNAFQDVWNNRKPAPEGDWFSPFKELDLFVTGTDVLGKVSRHFDNTGKLIEVNDHHAVFILKHREGRKEPFKPETDTIPRALAKLCRITSCFPVAFPVVTVKLEKPVQPNKQEAEYSDWNIDAELVKWGNLNERVKPKKEDTVDGYQLHFVDGGVLDNRPFSYTIKEIYYRHFYRPVNRKLFYIDPSPDKFLDSRAFKRMEKPNIWESAIDSLVGLPRYESIAGDLQEITEQNEDVRRYKFLRSTAVRAFEAKLREGKLQPCQQSEEINTQTAANGEQDTQTIPTEEQIYLRCRLVGLRDQVLPLIIGLNQAETAEQNREQKTLLENAARLLTSYISDEEKQKERDKFLHKKGQEIHNLDVDHSIRQHFFILSAIVQAMEQEKYLDFHKDLEQLARYLNRQLSLLEVIKAAIDEMLTLKGVQKDFANLLKRATGTREELRPQIYDYLLHLHRFLLNVDALPSWKPTSDSDSRNFFQKLPDSLPDSLNQKTAHAWLPIQDVTDVFQQLKERAKQLEKVNELGDELGELQKNPIWNDKYNFVEGARNKSEAYYSILSKIAKTSKEIISRLQASKAHLDQENLENLRQELLDKFNNFDYIDQQVYPYEYLSNIQTENLIEIARISPDDANKGFGKGKKLEERLAGVQLGAFGGFFKKSWRSNDILWGRLDGLNRLVDCLLTPETVKNFAKFLDREISKNNIQKPKEKELDSYLSDLLDAALPNATPDEKVLLQNSLKQLYHGSLTDQDFESFLEKLVLIGQRAILQTDLENVLKDSIEEQFTWNQQLVAPQWGNLGYRSVKIPNSSNLQLKSLRKINGLLESLLDTKSKRPIPAEEFDDLFQVAFSKATNDDRDRLSYHLKRVSDRAKTFSNEFVNELFLFLDLLLAVSEREEQNCAAPQVKNVLHGINEQLRKVVNKLIPKFSAMGGYLDNPLIPFATSSLVNPSIQEILQDPRKTEDYFRYQYRVGSEKINKNIPPIILEGLLARSGLVIRNVLRSHPTKEFLSKSATFQFVDRLLQTFYLWVEAKNPSTSFVPKALLPLLSWIVVILVVAGTAFLVSQIPSPFLVGIITLLILQLIYSFVSQNKVTKQIFQGVSFTLITAIAVSALMGSPLLRDGIVQLRDFLSHPSLTIFPK